ncbi:NAD(P)H-quinone oxidoreductase [Streptomyces sp. NPDC085942]|uniref:NAD(P)H-quinone oxidoreductase n=1 Tax=Streptomyces sp. NPDC085942 TaxID=3365743 RepID=UPI0037D6B6EB
MKAVSIKEPGGPEVLEWVEVEDPSPAPGEVVIDVVAGALNRADVMQRWGLYPLRPGTSPYPGLEVSGRISALGEGVAGWRVGDEVCALLTGGGYAQKVAVPVGQLLAIPRGIGLAEAAGLPETAATVWSNIVMTAGLKAGETILVHGGAGGVGTMAIQVAKALGARVVTTVGGPEKIARARELGADRAIDYRTEDFAEHGPYDVILDVIGGDYLERNVRSLAVDGRLVVIGLQKGLEGSLNLAEIVFKRVSVYGTTLRTRPKEQKAEIVAEVQKNVWPLIESGSVQLVIDRRVPMAEAAEAHRLMEAGGHVGKILLINDETVRGGAA